MKIFKITLSKGEMTMDKGSISITKIMKTYVILVFYIGFIFVLATGITRFKENTQVSILLVILYIAVVAIVGCLVNSIARYRKINKLIGIGLFIIIAFLTMISGSFVAGIGGIEGQLIGICSNQILFNCLGQMCTIGVIYCTLNYLKIESKDMANIFEWLGYIMTIFTLIIVLMGGQYEKILFAPIAIMYIIVIYIRMGID